MGEFFLLCLIFCILWHNLISSCRAEQLWHHLRRMGLHETDESNPVLGNIKQALEMLVQQRLEVWVGTYCLLYGVFIARVAHSTMILCINKHALLWRYLQKDKVNGPEGNTLVYELAERALDGPVNDRIKEYISQVCFIYELNILVFLI